MRPRFGSSIGSCEMMTMTASASCTRQFSFDEQRFFLRRPHDRMLWQ